MSFFKSAGSSLLGGVGKVAGGVGKVAGGAVNVVGGVAGGAGKLVGIVDSSDSDLDLEADAGFELGGKVTTDKGVDKDDEEKKKDGV